MNAYLLPCKPNCEVRRKEPTQTHEDINKQARHNYTHKKANKVKYECRPYTNSN